MLVGDIGVSPHGDGYVGVAKDLLQGAHISTAHEEMRAESLPQLVRVQGILHAYPFPQPAEHMVEMCRCPLPPARIEEERRLAIPGSIFLEHLRARRPEWDYAGLTGLGTPALSHRHLDKTVFNIGYSQVAELPGAEPRLDEEIDNIPVLVGMFEDMIHLFLREEFDSRPGIIEPFDMRARVFSNEQVLLCPVEKHGQRPDSGIRGDLFPGIPHLDLVTLYQGMVDGTERRVVPRPLLECDEFLAVSPAGARLAERAGVSEELRDSLRERDIAGDKTVRCGILARLELPECLVGEFLGGEPQADTAAILVVIDLPVAAGAAESHGITPLSWCYCTNFASHRARNIGHKMVTT